MKKEIELKFFVDDLGPVRKKLKKLGAKLLWKGREENWLFDTKSHLLQKRRVVLRVKKSDAGRLTWKEKQRIERGAKVAHEYEVVVDRPLMMVEILKHLGYIVWVRYSKYREHWQLSRAHLELDTLDGKWKFVEIEAGHGKIMPLAKILGLDFKNGIKENYIQLLEKLRKKKLYNFKPG